MKSNRRPIIDCIYLGLLCAIAFAFPFHRVATSIPTVFLTATWLIYIFTAAARGTIRERLALIRMNRGLYLLFIGLFLLYLIGMLYTADSASGWNEIQRKLALVIFPTVLFTGPKINRQNFLFILIAFVLGCFAVTVLAYGNALIKSSMGLKYNFFYTNLISFTNLHPSYLSMFIIFAICCTAYAYIRYRGSLSAWHQAVMLIAVVNFTVFLFLLTARIEIIAFFVILNCGILAYSIERKNVKTGLFVLVVFNLVAGASILSIPNTAYRFGKILKGKEDGGPVTWRSVTSGRSQIWESALHLYEQSPIIGVGTGDAYGGLMEQFKEDGFKGGVEKRFNAHNQYIQTLMTIGLPGFAVLVAALLYPFAVAARRRDYLYMAFLLLFIICNLTESMIQSQSGVVFYAYFNALLAYVWLGKELKDLAFDHAEQRFRSELPPREF